MPCTCMHEMRAQRLTYVTYVHSINAGQVPIHMATDAARWHAYFTPPGMRKRCVCAVFRSGGLSGNARAAMPRRGGRSRAAPGPYGPWPQSPRPVCLGVVWFWFVPFYKGPPGTHMHPTSCLWCSSLVVLLFELMQQAHHAVDAAFPSQRPISD